MSLRRNKSVQSDVAIGRGTKDNDLEDVLPITKQPLYFLPLAFILSLSDS
jgi:hypothetical protein